MKRVPILFVFLFAILQLHAQEFTVPKDYKLEVAEDYAQYEQDVVNAIEWVLNTPVDEQLSKRVKANAFIMKWLTGSPTVKVEIHPEIVSFIDSGHDLMMPFLGGWTKYCIETKDYDNKVAGNLAGLEAVMEFYEENDLPKNKKIEDYIKLHKNDKLKGYIERRVSQ